MKNFNFYYFDCLNFYIFKMNFFFEYFQVNFQENHHQKLFFIMNLYCVGLIFNFIFKILFSIFLIQNYIQIINLIIKLTQLNHQTKSFYFLLQQQNDQIFSTLKLLKDFNHFKFIAIFFFIDQITKNQIIFIQNYLFLQI